jgi:V8-like Glu-specific endopeptidase
MSRHSPLLLLSVLAIGCSDPTTGASQQAIVGGTGDSGDPSVLLMFAGQQTNQMFQGGTCTSEVISPHALLTAAHCVVDFGTGAHFRVMTGSGGLAGFHTGTSYTVKEAHAHPDYVKNPDPGLGHDVAILITDAAMPLTPLPLHRDPVTDDMVGKPVRMVGYGITSTDAADSGEVKRQTTTTLSDYDGSLLIFNDNAAHGTCEGDSGGPAFQTLNGVETIIGITSFGDTTDCTGTGYDTRVDTNLDFIDSMRQLADPPPPDMVVPPDMVQVWNGTYPVGTVGASCHDNTECYSGICTSGGERFCTQTCDPNANQCPLGTHCGTIDSLSVCVRDRSLHSGSCETGAGTAGGAPATGAACLLIAAMGLFFVRRRLRS